MANGAKCLIARSACRPCSVAQRAAPRAALAPKRSSAAPPTNEDHAVEPLLARLPRLAQALRAAAELEHHVHAVEHKPGVGVAGGVCGSYVGGAWLGWRSGGGLRSPRAGSTAQASRSSCSVLLQCVAGAVHASHAVLMMGGGA